MEGRETKPFVHIDIMLHLLQGLLASINNVA